jgi:hypothetical protein
MTGATFLMDPVFFDQGAVVSCPSRVVDCERIPGSVAKLVEKVKKRQDPASWATTRARWEAGAGG